MIRHCVMFRWNDNLSPATISEVEAALTKLPAAITAIASYSFGRDIGVNTGNFEFAVVADQVHRRAIAGELRRERGDRFASDHLTPTGVQHSVLGERTAEQLGRTIVGALRVLLYERPQGETVGYLLYLIHAIPLSTAVIDKRPLPRATRFRRRTTPAIRATPSRCRRRGMARSTRCAA